MRKRRTAVAAGITSRESISNERAPGISNLEVGAEASAKERCAISETGTGSACALLSEIRSSRR